MNQSILGIWFQALKYSFVEFLLTPIGTVVVARLIGRIINRLISFVFITTLLLFGFIYLSHALKFSR